MNRKPWKAAAFVAVLLAAGLPAAPTVAAARAPVTVALTTRPIVSLAVGGGRVGFRTRRRDVFGRACNTVHVVPLRGGRSATLRRCPAIELVNGHPFIENQPELGVAVAAHTLVYDWVGLFPVNATHDDAVSMLWRVGPHRRRRLAVESYEVTCAGSAVGRFAYAGGVAFTRTVATEVDPQLECQLGSGGGPGVSSMTAAGLEYVPAGTTAASVIPGAPGAARIAAWGTRVALVPLQLPQPMGKRITPPSAALAEVQSWNVATATRSCRASLPGPPSAVATNGTQIAAIVPVSGGSDLVRLSARTCTPLHVRALGTRIRAEVALGRRFAVWAKGGSVFGLDMATGHVLRLHTGQFAPQGLVITAGRLVWWVNVRGHGHILRLRLP